MPSCAFPNWRTTCGGPRIRQPVALDLGCDVCFRDAVTVFNGGPRNLLVFRMVVGAEHLETGMHSVHRKGAALYRTWPHAARPL